METKMEAEFKCERCKPGHDFKNKHNLKKHQQSLSHKRKFDPEFAAAEEAEKATKKAASGAKEKARLAARDQSADNIKRKRSKAHVEAKQREKSRMQYRKQTDGDPAPWITGNGTEEDVLKALVRYHGSTSVAMLLHTDNERIKSNIRKFVRVSPEVKAKIRKTWQEGEMATNRAHYSCATCGIRDHGHYAQIDVAALPDFFKFREKDQAMFDVLKGLLFA
jgi:L-lactate utilization protein LutC